VGAAETDRQIIQKVTILWRSGSTLDSFGEVTTIGTEAAIAARLAGVETDLEFGISSGVPEAAMKGLDVMVLAVEDSLTPLLEQLRQKNVSYELVDKAEL